MKQIRGQRTIWLLIETSCFFMYVLSASIYIAGRMIISSCFEKANEPSDMNKAVTDFIVYANINLTWFAFNFVMTTLPPLCLYAYNFDGLGNLSMLESYEGIMYVLWIMHLITFAIKPRIYYPKLKDADKIDEDNSDNFTSALIMDQQPSE